MSSIRVSLKHASDATLDATWCLYHAFIGRYYQTTVQSEVMFRSMVVNDTYEPWIVMLAPEQYRELVTLNNDVLKAVFKIEYGFGV